MAPDVTSCYSHALASVLRSKMASHRRRRGGQKVCLPGLTLQEQEDVLDSLHPELRALNLEQIFPHLNQQGLLSYSEKEKLKNEYFTTHERIDELLKWIPKKGSDALARFIECLRNSTDGTGHDELATLLENELKKMHSKRQLEANTAQSFKELWKVLTAAILLIVFAVILVVFVPHLSHMRHRQVWLSYSPSLPDFIPHFLGRDKEMTDLVELLDPENTDVRTVSIVGPPGFGKSSLAIQVGHEMIDKGAVVNYVNLDEVTIDGIPEKIIGNAGITTKNDSVDRLIKWAKYEVSYPVVIILDNCDDILHKRQTDFHKLLRSVRTSATPVIFKFLLTSKHKINILDEFEEYTLGEISLESSCKLLHRMTKREIDGKTCETITNLIGNIPLALKVVGAILRTRTKDVTQIISNLSRELLRTLNPSDLDQRINASLSLSYTYLSATQKRLGRNLALFPGSFTATDACHTLAKVIESDCSSINAEIEVLDQRSLLQFTGNGRYQFHKIIKEFFVVIRQSHDAEKSTSAFLTGFQVHYGIMLFQLSMTFENDYVSALHTLDVEKHNVQYLLEHFEETCLMDLDISLIVFQAIDIALERHFLTCRFTAIELKRPLEDITECIVTATKRILRVEISPNGSVIDPKQKEKVEKFLTVLIHMALRLHNFEIYYDDTPLFEVELLLGWVEDIIDVPGAANFYNVLGSHYHATGELHKEKRCHETILQKANAKLDNCQPGLGSCEYYTISIAYFHLEKYEDSAHFLELDLELNEENMSLFNIAKTLRLLYVCQYRVGNETRARNTTAKLSHLLPSLINASTPELYANLQLLSEISTIFHLNGMTDEATQLGKKQIMAIKEINATEAHYGESFALQAFLLAENLLEAEQYAEVPEVAVVCTLNLLKPQNKTKLHLILGKAEYYNGRKAASIENLKAVVGANYDHPHQHQMAREACHYLVAQYYVDGACIPIKWCDLKTKFYRIFTWVLSDTVTVDDFISPSGHKEAFSTDIALSSTYLNNLPFELATFVIPFYTLILGWCIQFIKYIFCTLLNLLISIFSVSFLLHVINYVLVAGKVCMLCLWLYFFCCIPSHHVLSFLMYIAHNTMTFDE